MENTSPTTKSPEVLRLLERIVRLRNRFKVVVPENISNLKQQLHDSAVSGKNAGINDPGLFYIVGTLFAHAQRPVTMGELSRDLDVPLSTATRTMDWLVSNGYARRLPDPDDRRVVRVAPTDLGKDTFRAIQYFMLERVEQAMNRLTPSEQETFMSLFEKIMNAFDETATKQKY